MRTSPVQRWLALVLACWLSLVQSDAGVFHACNSGSAPQAAVAVATPANHAAHSAHDAHAAHGHQDGVAPAATTPQVSDSDSSEHPDSHGSHHGDTECHCLGHCCPVAPTEMPVAHDFALATVRRVDVVQPGRAQHAFMASWVDFVLPFATAPPVVRIA